MLFFSHHCECFDLGHVADVFVQIFCVFMFLIAISLFGTLISQLNEIVAARTSQTKDLDNALASYLTIKPKYVV